MSSPQFRFIDVSGVGNSGKSAVVDLLREVVGVYVPEYWFECDILRVSDGLLDLRHHLISDWSPVRSHQAIRAFIDVAQKMGCDPAWWDLPGVLRSTSQRYDRHFSGQFTKHSVEFARSFIRTSYKAAWPFDELREDTLIRVVRKILRRLGMRQIREREVIIADGTGFDAKAHEYLRSLYSAIVPAGTDRVVLNNGFEPFNPGPALDMLPDSRQIVVTRGPRDIYVSGSDPARLADSDKALVATEANYGLRSSFLATDDLSRFVERLRVYYSHLRGGTDARVLQVRFEDCVRDYRATSMRIFSFLAIDPERHHLPGSHFRPERSAENIGLWRRYSKQADIDYIARALPELLVDA